MNTASDPLSGVPPQVALVYGQMNEPPGARARVALTGLTVAEYFRDQEGQDVLLFIDNIFRFTQAGSEVSVQCELGGKGVQDDLLLFPSMCCNGLGRLVFTP